jgi:hypothetical protein
MMKMLLQLQLLVKVLQAEEGSGISSKTMRTTNKRAHNCRTRTARMA